MHVYYHIKRDDGFQIKINTLLHVDNFRANRDGEHFNYSPYIEVRDKGKRKWRSPMDISENATDEEILAAKMALWESIKPV